jgi:hypothetical protein
LEPQQITAEVKKLIGSQKSAVLGVVS